ncbi:MAG: TRAP transporter small permease [Acetobacteraceae bacterium]|jgi:TRAP-type C4-dicarboxylate transport system permease small subunit|nr:TRAP transporter small permease [Acetobacteraceae bacterium]
MRFLRLPLQIAAVACLAALVILPSVQVVARDLFVSPIVGIEELARLALILLVFLAYPLVVDAGEDIVMAEAKAMLPGLLRRGLDAVIALGCAAAAFFMAWAVWAALAANPRNMTPTLEIPFWIFLASAGLGFGAAGLLRLYRLFRPGAENPTLV